MAISTAFVLPGAAFADVKVYGKFNVGLDDQKDEIGITSSNGTNSSQQTAGSVKYADSTWSLHDQNNSSRLGFKGDTELGVGDLKAIFQLEYGVNPFGSEAVGGGSTAQSTFSQRNIFVGLQGGFGTIKAGRIDTPLKLAGEKADQFNDEGIGDDTNLMVGETRINNIIVYTSPKIAEALTVNLAVVPGGGRTALDDTNSVDKSIADTYYASLVFENEMLFGSVSYAANEPGSLKVDGKASVSVPTPIATQASSAGVDILRVVGAVKPIVDLELNALFQQAKGIDQKGSATSATASELKETTYLVGAGYSIEAFKLKAEYGQTKADYSDIKRDLMAFGIDYKLNKAFTTQLYYIQYQDKDRTISLTSPTTAVTDPKTTAFGLGVVFTF
ncbi:porin [Solimonas aquatica]|nr:porin [Solimonas aquatica]